jgi:hypothetical protein
MPEERPHLLTTLDLECGCGEKQRRTKGKWSGSFFFFDKKTSQVHTKSDIIAKGTTLGAPVNKTQYHPSAGLRHRAHRRTLYQHADHNADHYYQFCCPV